MIGTRAMQTRRRAARDHWFLVLTIVLVIFGLLILMSASAPLGYDRFADRYFFIKRQLLLGLLPGLVAFFVCHRLPYSLLSKLAWPAYLLGIVLLILTFVPGIGTSLGTGSRSWLQIGPYSFQPAEVTKLTLILFLSAAISQPGLALRDFTKGFLPTLAFASIPIGLIVMQPDVGTAAIVFALVFGLLYIGGARTTHLIGLAVIGLSGLALMIAVAPYRAARLVTFLHPELDPLGIGYHMNQAFLAIGSGGWLGLGLGRSRQKFEYLPQVHADSIFAILAEEMGFIFAAGLVVLLVILAYRGLRLAKLTRDQFGRLLIVGIIIWILTQSFLNIGAMVGILPLTGVPLPFISHGGTAMVVTGAAVGLIMNVSRFQ